MFNKEVKTADGVVRTVVADDQEALDAAVVNAEATSASVNQDINNPKHGNMTDAEFAEFLAKKKSAKSPKAEKASEPAPEAQPEVEPEAQPEVQAEV